MLIEKPWGTHDFLPGEAAQKKQMEDRLLDLFARWGYQLVETPPFELDASLPEGPRPGERRFQFFDDRGRLLVLRPEWTFSIARLAATSLREKPLPLRLCYSGPVFHAEQGAGRDAVFHQVGVELLGCAAPEGDAEVLALASDALRAVRLERVRLVVGHTRFLDGLTAELEEAQAQALREALVRRDLVGYQAVAATLPAAVTDRTLLQRLPTLRGDAAFLQQLQDSVEGKAARHALQELLEVAASAHAATQGFPFLFDLSLLRHPAYYTGLIFEGYVSGVAFPIVGGGRYDKLLDHYGRPAPATGFAIGVERLMDAGAVSEAPVKPIYLWYGSGEEEEAWQLAERLRQRGQRVVCGKEPPAAPACYAAVRRLVEMRQQEKSSTEEVEGDWQKMD